MSAALRCIPAFSLSPNLISPVAVLETDIYFFQKTPFVVVAIVSVYEDQTNGGTTAVWGPLIGKSSQSMEYNT